MVNVAFQRADFKDIKKQWEEIADCYAGQHAIKSRREKYLPRPNPEDTSKGAAARYDAYITRAVFYNVTKRTLKGLVGLLFMRDPEAVIPAGLEMLDANANGAGASLTQLGKFAARMTVGFGRCGLFTDYPSQAAPLSKAAQAAADAPRPIIRAIEPWKVINWRTVFRNAMEILSLVVIEERYVKADDGFVVTYGVQWRVLRLEGADAYATQEGYNAEAEPPEIPANVGIYSVTVYRDSDRTKPSEYYIPTDGEGNEFNVIPFIFIGSEDNTAGIDDPPLYDLAALNLAHYRNSADYEESVFIIGQPTPYFTGLTEQWVNTVLKGTIQLGSRASIALPVNATAGLLQVAANGMAFEAMGHKEKQMIAVGANLIDTTKGTPRTATESLIDDNNERSVLTTVGDNVSEAFVMALTWAAMYANVDVLESPALSYQINTDFDLVRLTPQERQELVAEWQAEAISWTELRRNLRRGGVATQEDAEAKADIEANPPPPPVTMPKPMPAGNAGGNDPNGNGNSNGNSGNASE